jgi:hypothetical protein
MFPAPTFAAGNAVFKSMRPADHKNDFLNRVLDFGQEQALTRFVADQATAGTPLTTGDKLGAIVIPQNTLLLGVFYEVEVAGKASLTITPSLRVLGTAQPVIACSALSKGFAAMGGASWITANGAAAGNPIAMLTPDVLDLTITAIGSGLGALRLNIGIVLRDLASGQY